MEPYIYSDEDIRRLLDAAQTGRCYPADATLLGLLATTGMRVGEAIRLDRSDFDSKQGILTLRQGKLGKSRQIVLHPSTTEALLRYARRRERQTHRPQSPAFFLSRKGKRLIYNNVHFRFFQIVAKAGLDHGKPRRPRIHDLRHSFAIRVLVGWYRAGLDTGPRLPILSTYLGHVSPSSTYWYLTATPEILQQACRRLEGTSGGQP
jgi:integrase